jgi:hypothetical protein
MIRRLRRTILITGTTLCVLIAAAFVVSAWWWVDVELRTPYGTGMRVVAGEVRFPGGIGPEVVRHGYGLILWNSWYFSGTSLEVPLYAVFAAVAVPTLLAWRFWPKPIKPGHCRCGYDLTGNTSGVCPECGQRFEAKGDAP